MLCFITFAGEVQAVKSAWIIGDDFLLDIFGTLHKLKSEAIANNRPIPYLFDYYNVQFFTGNPLSEIKDVLTKLVNSLIKALNDTSCLPRLILVIPDHDILKHIGKLKPGAESMYILQKTISWVMNQMERAILAKEDELRKKKPGSITLGEPKFIWVKMINRPLCNGILEMRQVFNDAVEECMLDRAAHYILTLIIS